MRYWIEYADGRCCNFANSRKDLLDWLKLLKDEKIVDIRKIYKSGVTDSVIDSYPEIFLLFLILRRFLLCGNHDDLRFRAGLRHVSSHSSKT